jgi:hypothetical protein
MSPLLGHRPFLWSTHKEDITHHAGPELVGATILTDIFLFFYKSTLNISYMLADFKYYQVKQLYVSILLIAKAKHNPQSGIMYIYNSIKHIAAVGRELNTPIVSWALNDIIYDRTNDSS